MDIVNKSAGKFLVSEKLGNVKHGFSLRCGGVSSGDFESMNVGLRRGDDPFDALENIRLCLDMLDMDKRSLTMTYQTHTANVRFLTKDDIGKGFIREWGEGVDGIITDMLNVPVMCYSADCVPTLLYERKAGLIGAVHGGWRGTGENIILNAVNLMCAHGGTKEEITAFIGPAIGMCCYEVSEDVGALFAPEYGEFVKRKDNGKYMIDLKKITKAQLLNAGVLPENIENSDICTSCRNDMFFSHRRQRGRCGLLGGFIQMD